MQVEKPDTAVPWKSSFRVAQGLPCAGWENPVLRLTCKKGILFPVRRGEIRSVGGLITCAGMGELQLFHAAVLFSFSDGSIALLFEGRNTFLGVFYFFVPGIGKIPAFAEPAAAIGKRPARDCLDAGGSLL